MFFDDSEILHIPEGINYDCTGCGNCCLQWPVPSTDEDRTRIIDLSRSLVSDASNVQTGEQFSLPKGQLFRRIDMDVLRNKTNQFQFTMEKRADGRCVFLSEQNQCMLHIQFGAEAKPGMCQLFPYTFTQAPDGYYASVSFASSGALFNQGRALEEQRDHLLNRLHLFNKLFPSLKLDWSQTQLADGVPIRWSQYLLLERVLLGKLRSLISEKSFHDVEHSFSWSKHLLAFSDHLISQVPDHFDLEKAEAVPSSSLVDLLLIKHLSILYLPENIFSADDEPTIRDFLKEVVDAPDLVSLAIDGQQLDLAAVCAQPLPALAPEVENLFARYLYARIFSKLYFGAGMAHFSLISGFHHLAILIVLIRIRLKCMLWVKQEAAASQRKLAGSQSEDVVQLDFLQVAEVVRSIERRLASYQHSAESATVLQVLFESPSRFKRLVMLAN